MLFTDRLTLDKPHRTADGYLVTRAKAARTGVYQYAGTEVDPNNDHGLRDEAVVNVLRDDATVFDRKAVHSFIGKPITNDHPSEAVTADNWKDHARGVVMGAMKDGEHLSFDLLLTDKAAIDAVDGGKRELSNGYAADLEFGDFTAPDGTMCQARQTSIRGNHVALVDRGRAGSECRIADAARCTSLPADVFELLTDSAAKGDYGSHADAGYADPGYQDDGKPRYPLKKNGEFDEERIRAAWNYVHKKANADKYSSGDLAKIKAKIVAAWKAKIDKAGPPSMTADGRTYSGKKSSDKNEPPNRLHDGDSQVAKTILIDGYKFEVDDALETAVSKLQSQVKDATEAKDKAETKVGELTATVSTKDGEIAALNAKLKDAEVSPEKLEQLAADRASLVAQAKAIDANVVTDGKSADEIRKAVVTAKLGDAAKDMNDGAIAGAFTVLAKDVKVDPVRAGLSGGVQTNVDDAAADYEKASEKRKAALRDAYKTPAKADA